MKTPRRKSPLSSQPGHKVTLVYVIKDGSTTREERVSYSWVQTPYLYIKKVLQGDTPGRHLVQAWVDDSLKWDKNDPTTWKF